MAIEANDTVSARKADDITLIERGWMKTCRGIQLRLAYEIARLFQACSLLRWANQGVQRQLLALYNGTMWPKSEAAMTLCTSEALQEF